MTWEGSSSITLTLDVDLCHAGRASTSWFQSDGGNFARRDTFVFQWQYKETKDSNQSPRPMSPRRLAKLCFYRPSIALSFRLLGGCLCSATCRLMTNCFLWRFRFHNAAKRLMTL
jgi:hypothetical protein